MTKISLAIRITGYLNHHNNYKWYFIIDNRNNRVLIIGLMLYCPNIIRINHNPIPKIYIFGNFRILIDF